jgi:hypothetical protein
MRSISERDLAVVIPLVAAKIRDMTAELAGLDERLDELGDADTETRCDLQEMLESYHGTLDALREEYQGALAEGINLPSYEQLTRPFALT